MHGHMRPCFFFPSYSKVPRGFLGKRRGASMSGFWMLASTALYYDVKLVFIFQFGSLRRWWKQVSPRGPPDPMNQHDRVSLIFDYMCKLQCSLSLPRCEVLRYLLLLKWTVTSVSLT